MEGLPLKVSLALGDAAVLHMSVPCGALQTAVLDNLDAILQLGLSHSMAMGVSPEEALRFNEALGAARTAPSEAPCTPERQPRRSRSRTPPKVESQNSSISGLKAELARYGVDTSRCLEKKDLEELLKKCQREKRHPGSSVVPEVPEVTAPEAATVRATEIRTQQARQQASRILSLPEKARFLTSRDWAKAVLQIDVDSLSSQPVQQKARHLLAELHPDRGDKESQDDGHSGSRSHCATSCIFSFSCT
eukprot:s4456_g2.t1